MAQEPSIASEEELAAVLASRLSLPRLHLASAAIQAEAIAKVPEKVARKCACLPVKVEGRSLVAAFADGTAGKLPPTQSGLELSRPGIRVTAFGPNPGGEGLLLRLWEEAGVSGTCEVQLPAGLRPASVQPVDLRGQSNGASIPVTNGRFKAPVAAFAPASYKLQ